MYDDLTQLCEDCATRPRLADWVTLCQECFEERDWWGGGDGPFTNHPFSVFPRWMLARFLSWFLEERLEDVEHYSLIHAVWFGNDTSPSAFLGVRTMDDDYHRKVGREWHIPFDVVFSDASVSQWMRDEKERERQAILDHERRVREANYRKMAAQREETNRQNLLAQEQALRDLLEQTGREFR